MPPNGLDAQLRAPRVEPRWCPQEVAASRNESSWERRCSASLGSMLTCFGPSLFSRGGQVVLESVEDDVVALPVQVSLFRCWETFNVKLEEGLAVALVNRFRDG